MTRWKVRSRSVPPAMDRYIILVVLLFVVSLVGIMMRTITAVARLIFFAGIWDAKQPYNSQCSLGKTAH